MSGSEHLFNLTAAVIVGQNFLVIAALLRHIICAVLAHSDAVAVAVNRKHKIAVGVFDLKIRGTEGKQAAYAGAVYFGAADFHGFYAARFGTFFLAKVFRFAT